MWNEMSTYSQAKGFAVLLSFQLVFMFNNSLFAKVQLRSCCSLMDFLDWGGSLSSKVLYVKNYFSLKIKKISLLILWPLHFEDTLPFKHLESLSNVKYYFNLK